MSLSVFISGTLISKLPFPISAEAIIKLLIDLKNLDEKRIAIEIDKKSNKVTMIRYISAKETLIPVLQIVMNDGVLEGAIVLPPKSKIYLEEPVACVDYSSLYPSCMISENISHDSKVWTKQYDLDDNLIIETGYKDENNIFIYDNLPDFKYVDINYDTYEYMRKTPKAAPTKVKTGYKICRYAQFPNDRKAIMPSILEELLAARKYTRKQIPLQTDEFMKNLLDFGILYLGG